MPLYMEFHKAEHPSMQNMKDKAEAASKILERFSVHYLQLWINEDAGTVFSLIEGPNRAICEAVHKSIYGGEFETFMPVKECLAASEAASNTNDPSRIRQGFFLAVFDTSAKRLHGEMGYESTVFTVSRQLIQDHGGVCISATDAECTQAHFSQGLNAFQCGIGIQSALLSLRFLKFRIALTQSALAKEDENKIRLFARPVHMQSISADSRMVVSSAFRDLVRNVKGSDANIQLLSPQDEMFLNLLFGIIDGHLQDDEFNVDGLARYAGISRPQLYRKVLALTSRSPNCFIRDLRMEKALKLLRTSYKNICEIAFEVGYTNPSYFARSFSEKYGCTPSEFLLHSSG